MSALLPEGLLGPPVQLPDKPFSYQTGVNRELNIHLSTQRALSVCISACCVCSSTVHVYRTELVAEASQRRTAVEWRCRYLVSSAACRFKEQRRHFSIPNRQQYIRKKYCKTLILLSTLSFSPSLLLSNPVGLCSPKPLYNQAPSPACSPCPATNRSVARRLEGLSGLPPPPLAVTQTL